MKKLITIIILIGILSSCLVTNRRSISEELDLGVKIDQLSDDAKLSFFRSMKKCGFEGWGVGVVWEKSIQFMLDPFGENERRGYVSKFSIKYGDYIHGGTRAELNRDYGDHPGEEVWYSWSVLIPEDYEDNFLKNQDTGASNWQIIGQWHDQPDPSKGENWDNYPKNSPPVSIQYSYLTLDDPEFTKIMSSGSAINLIGYRNGMDEQSIISLSYGVPPKTVAIFPIEKGKWYDLTFNIKWSQENDGFVEVFVNGESFTNGRITGSNMYNSMSNYLKIGLYRNSGITSANSIYFDDVKYGLTRESVIR